MGLNSGNLRVVIISGLSGSGKTTAVKALEDSGFYCIDNLPPVLLDQFLLLCRDNPEIPRVGLVIDVRGRAFLSHFDEAFRRALNDGFRPEVVFLTCDDAVLVSRFSETRRLHPVEGDDVAASVARERELLAPLLNLATTVIDTTALTVHDLKLAIRDLMAASGEAEMQVRVLSFGFKHGIPRDADYVFDVRFLPNPYFVAELRAKSGKDPEICDYLDKQELTAPYLEHLSRLLQCTVPAHRREGKMRLTIAVGCTGGRHRSVFVAERVARRLEQGGFAVQLDHRDLQREEGA
jgi:UPF0042 nucleotide-binding protein